MSRVVQTAATMGSQNHLQRLVNDPNDPLGMKIRQLANFEADEKIVWKSPLATDDYAEYRDEDFVNRLGLRSQSLSYPLRDFWPRNGPQWDALAQTNTQRIILVEAKSHLGEMGNSCKATDPASVRRIQSALNTTKAYFGSSVHNDWSMKYYQYANRLAHLYWLTELNKIKAHLVFIYFINDSWINSPRSTDDWERELDKVHAYLGLNARSLPDFIHNLFFDINQSQ